MVSDDRAADPPRVFLRKKSFGNDKKEVAIQANGKNQNGQDNCLMPQNPSQAGHHTNDKAS